MKAKKIWDRIFKTIMIVIDVLWSTEMLLYGIGILFQDHYAVENTIGAATASLVAMVMVNLINILIRRWIRNY